MKTLFLALAIGTLAFTSATRAADAPKPYALDYCVYSGDKIGTMGKPVTEVYEGQEIKFCCKDCQKTFDKDPAAGLKKYQAAVQSKSSGGSNAPH
ncbi:MAG: hypothetical protein PHC88_08700 [Terrimicrobiaceae bacterium]|nr:hypothetical protein [Terrimicrobiaceae bacterium]